MSKKEQGGSSSTDDTTITERLANAAKNIDRFMRAPHESQDLPMDGGSFRIVRGTAQSEGSLGGAFPIVEKAALLKKERRQAEASGESETDSNTKLTLSETLSAFGNATKSAMGLNKIPGTKVAAVTARQGTHDGKEPEQGGGRDGSSS